ncbi:MAG: hypothetical protein ACOCUF_03430 [Patescibacteria group bacterium]
MSVIKNPDYQHPYQNYDFKGRRKNEEIILVLRRHWLIFVFKFLPFLFFALLIAILGGVIRGNFGFIQININTQLEILIELLFYLFIWLGAFVVWINYYLDVWIITDRRIIDVEQVALFRRSVSELEHSKIQDTTSEIHGFLPTLFRYGYIYIQTAGETQRFLFKQVPNPVKTRNIIMKLQKAALKKEKQKEKAILEGKL